ncbi:MAG: hypothetical protein DSM106950_44875 [Stigonema ocellatum SAG 48.90 = DSM 106950]|nr:hypothetical protein [Stigonema ocellatum SAG 48.90 = DSM 106950]
MLGDNPHVKVIENLIAIFNATVYRLPINYVDVPAEAIQIPTLVSLPRLSSSNNVAISDRDRIHFD